MTEKSCLQGNLLDCEESIKIVKIDDRLFSTESISKILNQFCNYKPTDDLTCSQWIQQNVIGKQRPADLLNATDGRSAAIELNVEDDLLKQKSIILFQQRIEQTADSKLVASGLKEACDVGNFAACFKYATFLETGMLLKQDINQAYQVYANICDQADKGDKMAQYYCGRIYLEGRQKIKLDLKKARSLFNAACQQSVDKACESLFLLKQIKGTVLE